MNKYEEMIVEEICKECNTIERIIVKLFKKLIIKIYNKIRLNIVNEFLK